VRSRTERTDLRALEISPVLQVLERALGPANRIGALLATLSVRDYNPLLRHRLWRFVTDGVLPEGAVLKPAP
jgi:hypothetical protein